MALTTEKTWQYGSSGSPYENINISTTAIGNPACAQRMHRNIKDCLLRVPLFPWSIFRCCDSTAVGSIGQDLWTADNDIVGGTGNHSWIVYEQPGIATNFQMCFDFNHSYENYCTVVTSAGGFDDNGTVSSRPTASDERVHQSAVQFLTAAYNFNAASVLNVAVSDDGECTRILFLSSGVVKGFLLVDKPKLPEAGWTDPYVLATVTDGSGATTYGNLCNSVGTRSRFNGVNVNYYLGTLFKGGNAFGEDIGGQNDQLLVWECFPVWLCSGNDSDRRGTKGMLYDFWFNTVNAGIYTGDVYPAGGPYTHVNMEQVVFPWPDVVPLTS